MQLFFLIRSLEVGGAERQLVTLVKALYVNGLPCTVVTFYNNGLFANELQQFGVRIISLNKCGRWDLLPFLWRLYRILRSEKPMILHSYLTVANILTVFFKFFLSDMKVVWGVRASNMDYSYYDMLSRLTWWMECKLSRFADCIICNSRTGRDYAIEHGFHQEKMYVIFNGIDTEKFKLDCTAREHIRSKWNVHPHEKLIGLVARLDPMKDHPTFLRAAALLMEQRSDIRFVCVGEGPADYKMQLLSLASELGLQEKLIWAGTHSDMPSIYNAFDIACSSSFGEGFSNAIAEAMACGVPSIATDVGDSGLIVGNFGLIVPPHDVASLAVAINQLLTIPCEEFAQMKIGAREHIQKHFSIDTLVKNTLKVLNIP